MTDDDADDEDLDEKYPFPAPDPDGNPTGDTDEPGVPDSDPRHLDPAGDFADLVESGDLSMSVDDEADREELREWLDRAEAGEFGADPGVEATVRIVRALLDDSEARE